MPPSESAAFPTEACLEGQDNVVIRIIVLWIDEDHELFCADRHLILCAPKSLIQGDEMAITILSGAERRQEIIRSDP